MKFLNQSLAGRVLAMVMLLASPLVSAIADAAAPLSIATLSPLVPGTVGTSYTTSLLATGGTAPYTWTALAGMPNGLSLAAAGTIAGKPTTAGTFSVLVQVTDSATPVAATAFASLVIKIQATASPLAISTHATLPGGMVGSAYSQTLAATGGVAPYLWSLPIGTLPLGLTLSTAGVISGTPTTQGVSTFSARVTDSLMTTATQAFSLTVTPIAPTRSGVFSQVASGGGWKTSIYLINISPEPVPVVVQFRADSGALLSLPVTVTQNGVAQVTNASNVAGTVPANDTMLIESDSGATVESTGWAEVISTGPITGYAAFHYTSSTGVESEGTVPLEAAPESSFILPYDGVGGIVTGVALTNLAPDHPINVTATVWGNGGKQLYSQRINLPAGGHSAFILSSSFPGTVGNRGIVEFTAASSGTITGLGLRVDPSGGITSIPLLQRP